MLLLFFPVLLLALPPGGYAVSGVVNRLRDGGNLPSQFLGKYKLVGSEGFNDYLSAIGVSWFNRQFAKSLTPVETISQEHGRGLDIFILEIGIGAI